MKQPDLIIDVGMHRGEDTEFYLAKGFSVVAIEANPTLVAEVGQRLAAEIRSGRLRIIEGAIARSTAMQRLAVSDVHTLWSSLDSALVDRNEAAGAVYRYVTVPGIRFEQVLEMVGIPYYLKVDIEGHDMLCIQALHEFSDRPDYISLESHVSVLEAPFEPVFDELAELWTLGYRAFKYLDQVANPTLRLPPTPLEGRYVDAQFNVESSGPFGEETPGQWLSIERALGRAEQLRWHQRIAGNGGRWSRTRPAKAYLRARSRFLRRYPPGWYPMGWYDLHARLEPVRRG